MTRVIRRITTKLPDYISLYGFGSFFAGCDRYADVDIVVVFGGAEFQLEDLHLVREEFAGAGVELGVRFDLTFLTEGEFRSKPLRDMDTLIPIMPNSEGVDY